MPSPPLFSKAFKLRNRLIAATGMLMAAAAPFIAALLALGATDTPGRATAAGVTTALSFALAAWLPWQAGNLLALSGNRSLRRRVLKKIALERPEELQATSQFVGFSPGDQLRTWDGETDCDVGFLTALPSGLVYTGDVYTWSLRREHIDRLELTPPTGGIRRVVVRWHAPREPGRAFAMASREGATLRGINAATLRLGNDLQEWLEAKPEATGEHPLFGYPPSDAAGALDPYRPAPGSCVTTLSITVITVLTIWRVAGDFIEHQHYCYGILWSGLITVLAAGLTSHVLGYLRAWGATLPAKPKPRQRPPDDLPM